MTLKLHRASRSIGFIKKALRNEVTPKFAEGKDDFINAIVIRNIQSGNMGRLNKNL